MFKRLQNECLKLKGSEILYFILAGILLPPLALLMLVIILNSEAGVKTVSFLEYMALVIKFIMLLIAVTLYNWIAAEIVSKEFRLGTIKSQLTIPIGRTDFLFDKVLIISLILVLTTLCSYTVGYFIAWQYKMPGLNMDMLTDLLMVYFKASVLMLPMAYFTIYLVICFRSSIIPMAINLGIALIMMILGNHPIRALFPWTAPFRIVFVTAESQFTIGQSYMSVFLLGVISLFLANNKINKMEI